MRATSVERTTIDSRVKNPLETFVSVRTGTLVPGSTLSSAMVSNTSWKVVDCG